MCVHFFKFDHLRITLQSSNLIWGTKFHAHSLPLPPLIFFYLQALINGFLWWWASSWLIFSLKWRLLSTLLLLHSAAIKIQEAKDFIDEEHPRPIKGVCVCVCELLLDSSSPCSDVSSQLFFISILLPLKFKNVCVWLSFVTHTHIWLSFVTHD